VEREWNEDLLFYFLEPYLQINPAQFEHFAEYYYLSIFSLYVHYIIIDLCSIVNVHIFVDVVAHDDLISYTIFNCAIWNRYDLMTMLVSFSVTHKLVTTD